MTTPTAIPLKLRRLVWHDGNLVDPEDYEVIDARGESVGRINAPSPSTAASR